jgi:hypothetical protein
MRPAVPEPFCGATRMARSLPGQRWTQAILPESIEHRRRRISTRLCCQRTPLPYRCGEGTRRALSPSTPLGARRALLRYLPFSIAIFRGAPRCCPKKLTSSRIISLARSSLRPCWRYSGRRRIPGRTLAGAGARLAGTQFRSGVHQFRPILVRSAHPRPFSPCTIQARGVHFGQCRVISTGQPLFLVKQHVGPKLAGRLQQLDPTLRVSLRDVLRPYKPEALAKYEERLRKVGLPERIAACKHQRRGSAEQE